MKNMETTLNTHQHLRRTDNSKLKKTWQWWQKTGVYPYEYMDSFERLQEPQLPPKDAFFHLTEKDYTHAQRVFNHFNMTDLKDYHNFYLLTGVLLKADVFENFRDMCLQYYDLHPAHNYTFPDLSLQAALKITDVKLDLLTDTD